MARSVRGEESSQMEAPAAVFASARTALAPKPRATSAEDLAARARAIEAAILKTADQLDEEVRREGLDADAINERYNELSTEQEFLASLPMGVRDGYRELHEQIRELQDINLEQDGMTREALKKTPDDAVPEWVAEHANTLEKQTLPGDVAAFVARKSAATSIEDNDIRQLAALCASSWPCIERAAYDLSKANHQFTDQQFALLAQYNREASR